MGRPFEGLHLFTNLIEATELLGVGLPWWRSGEESTCQSRRHRFDPDPGRSHMLRSNKARVPQLLNLRPKAWELQTLIPCAATTEAGGLKLVLCYGQSRHNEN